MLHIIVQVVHFVAHHLQILHVLHILVSLSHLIQLALKHAHNFIELVLRWLHLILNYWLDLK